MPGVVNIEHALSIGILPRLGKGRLHTAIATEPRQSRYIVEIDKGISLTLIHQHRDGQGESSLRGTEIKTNRNVTNMN